MVTAGDLVVEFSNLMFPLNPFGSPRAKCTGGGNFISFLAAVADGWDWKYKTYAADDLRGHIMHMYI